MINCGRMFSVRCHEEKIPVRNLAESKSEQGLKGDGRKYGSKCEEKSFEYGHGRSPDKASNQAGGLRSRDGHHVRVPA